MEDHPNMFKPFSPWIVFNTEPDATGGGSGNQDQKPTIDGETFDFPLATPVANMTPEQAGEYWRHEAKKAHKASDAYKKLGTVDDVRSKITAADAAAAAALTDQERALNEARTEADTAGFTRGRDKFARPAVEGLLVASTRGAGETIEAATARVRGALEFVDVTKFITDDGDLDAKKVETFAQSLGSGAGNGGHQTGGDPLHQVLGTQGQSPEGAGGSVASYEEAARKRYAPKK